MGDHGVQMDTTGANGRPRETTRETTGDHGRPRETTPGATAARRLTACEPQIREDPYKQACVGERK